jgi:hypothetical protein
MTLCIPRDDAPPLMTVSPAAGQAQALALFTYADSAAWASLSKCAPSNTFRHASSTRMIPARAQTRARPCPRRAPVPAARSRVCRARCSLRWRPTAGRCSTSWTACSQSWCRRVSCSRTRPSRRAPRAAPQPACAVQCAVHALPLVKHAWGGWSARSQRAAGACQAGCTAAAEPGRQRGLARRLWGQGRAAAPLCRGRRFWWTACQNPGAGPGGQPAGAAPACGRAARRAQLDRRAAHAPAGWPRAHSRGRGRRRPRRRRGRGPPGPALPHAAAAPTALGAGAPTGPQRPLSRPAVDPGASCCPLVKGALSLARSGSSDRRAPSVT